MFPLAGCLLRVALHKAISLLRSYQLGKSIGATNIHMPVIHTKLSDFIQTTKFRKYPTVALYFDSHITARSISCRHSLAQIRQLFRVIRDRHHRESCAVVVEVKLNVVTAIRPVVQRTRQVVLLGSGFLIVVPA